MTGPALDPYNKSDPTPILHYVARSKGWIAQRPSIESKQTKHDWGKQYQYNDA